MLLRLGCRVLLRSLNGPITLSARPIGVFPTPIGAGSLTQNTDQTDLKFSDRSQDWNPIHTPESKSGKVQPKKWPGLPAATRSRHAPLIGRLLLRRIQPWGQAQGRASQKLLARLAMPASDRPFCGSSSGMSARAASSLQCGLRESTTGAGARALPGQKKPTPRPAGDDAAQGASVRLPH